AGDLKLWASDLRTIAGLTFTFSKEQGYRRGYKGAATTRGSTACGGAFAFGPRFHDRDSGCSPAANGTGERDQPLRLQAIPTQQGIQSIESRGRIPQWSPSLST